MSHELSMPRPARFRAQSAKLHTPKGRAAGRVPEAARDVPVVELRDVEYPAVDPMLLVYRERVATFRMLVRWLRRAFTAPKRRSGPRA